MFRIATWNLERPKLNGREKNDRILSKMKEINADVWIVTETNASISPGEEYFSAVTLPVSDYHALGESTTAVWTKLRMHKTIQTYDSNTAVCVEIDSSVGPAVVYGTIITWAHDKGQRWGSKPWQEHLAELVKQAEDWCRIRRVYPDHHLIVAGDFNQSLGERVENKEARELLEDALKKARLTCLTNRGFSAIDQVNIDHVCVSEDLVDKKSDVFAWSGSINGKKMSDHNGVCVAFDTFE